MRFVLLFLISFLVSAGTVHGQTGMPLGFEEQFSVSVSPKEPGPNTQTTIRLDSYSTNFNKSTISWYVNNQLVLKDIGANIFTFTTGPMGSKTVVRVTILKEDGYTLERKFTYQPSFVNLQYEALTYTPPFYKGKTLPTHQAQFKVIALPEITDNNGNLIPADQLVYKWHHNYTVLQDQSGYGKNVAIVEGPFIPRDLRIGVDVTALNSKAVAKNFVMIATSEPEVHVYTDHPLYGILFNNALQGTMQLTDVEARVVAFPYYFSTNQPEDFSMTYEWELNESDMIEQQDRHSLVINASEEERIARFNVFAKQKDKILQFAENTFGIAMGRLSNF